MLDTEEHGVTRTGDVTNGSVLELRFVAHAGKNSSLSPYANFVAQALQRWAEGEGKGLDGIGVHIRGTEFQLKVLKAMRNIEFASTASYQELAVLSGYPKAYRAVANVCASNRIPLIIPCHRIIKSDGSIGNYFYGTPLKRKMLAIESN